MNSICLVGRIVNDIELKITANETKVISFRIAVKRKFKDKNGDYPSDFINIVAFNNTAKYLDEYAEKGRMISVQGTLQSRQYKNSQDVTITTYEVIANEIDILDRKNDNLGKVENNTFIENANIVPDVYNNANNLEYDPFSEE